MRRKGRILLLLALLVLLAGCAKAAPDPTPTPVPLVGLPGGAEVPIDAESLDLSGIPAVETEAALAQLEQFPDLRELKLGGEGLFTLEQVERLQTEHPEWRLEYMLRIAGRDTGIEAESLDLSSLTADEVEQVLPRLRLMPRLRLVELGGERAEGPDWEQIRELEEAAANADFSYRFSIADRNFNLRDSELDLNHIPMTDEGALVRRIIACMPNLNYLCMDSCEVSNEAMAAIRDDYPWVEVVWRIWFGATYSVRTNVERILASKTSWGGEMHGRDVQVLKYCTKVKYLDLGHNNNIDDITFVRCMPDLEVFIIAMNSIVDISPLEDCHKLEYLELFMTFVADLSPLSGLTELRHLNVGMCYYLEDITPLYGLDLERFFIGTAHGVPKEQIDEYKRLHPDCEVNDVSYDTSNGRWRYEDEYGTEFAPRYALLREQFNYDERAYSVYWLDPDY